MKSRTPRTPLGTGTPTTSLKLSPTVARTDCAFRLTIFCLVNLEGRRLPLRSLSVLMSESLRT